MPDRLRRAGARAGHDGQPAGHGLEVDEARAALVGRRRGEDVTSRQDGRQVLAVDEPERFDQAVAPLPPRRLEQPIPQRVVAPADKLQPQVGNVPGQRQRRLGEQLDALVGGDLADEDDGGALGLRLAWRA